MRITTTNSIIDTMCVSVGKSYLDGLVDKYTNGFDDDVIDDSHRDIDDFVGGIGSREVLNNFKLPKDLDDFISNKHNLARDLACELDSSMPVQDVYFGFGDDFYDFHDSLLSYMKTAYNWLGDDSHNANMQLCFEFIPKEPSSYSGLSDIRTTYDSIMVKFNYNRYIKYTNHTMTSKEGCAYCISVIYLVIISNLYKILKPCIDDLYEFMKDCFTVLNPVVVGITTTSTYKLVGTSPTSVIYELLQLSSYTGRLNISKISDYCVKFSFRTYDEPFHDSTIAVFGKPEYENDSNGKRRVELLVGKSDNLLYITTTLVGMSIISDMTGMAGKKSLYSLPSKANVLGHIGLKTLSVLLSYTEQFAKAGKLAKQDIKELYVKKQPRLYVDNTAENRRLYKDILTLDRQKDLAFRSLDVDMTSSIVHTLITEFNLNRYAMDYVIIANELSNKSDSTITQILNDMQVADKQKALIRKLVKRTRVLKQQKPVYALNSIYKMMSD